MDEGDVKVLKEALCKQCFRLKKLYIELEEEREASATAADEALSMILRLQVEKAEEKMEAGQYKKLTEEKMRHNAEKWITSLKHQVQVLKQRLLSAGPAGVNDGDLGLCGPLTLKLNMFLNETGFRGSFRRNVSLSSIQLEQIFSEMDIVGKDRFPFHKGESICKTISDCNSQLMKYSEEHQRHCGDYKSLIKECTYQKFDLCTGVKELLRNESISTNDIFRFSGMSFGETRTNFSTKGVSSSPPPAENHEATAEFELKDKDVLSVSIPQVAKDCCLKGEDLLNRSLIYMDHAYKTRKTASITCHYNPVHSNFEIAPCKTEIDELKQWLLHLDDDGRTLKMDDPKRDNEQVKFLKEIQEQLNTIQLHIKNFLSRKQPQQDDSVNISSWRHESLCWVAWEKSLFK
ncbi:GTD-binding domain-containing protein [Dioscorea alata]|uniref:GTD-binding domain-containing protein n=1 Tax=Dioscorea alata TaxID=55571 RepID=A0ACB7UHS4_DIOAL|nr:GTD-binding domain-containing protein [Dioscorea alata]